MPKKKATINNIDQTITINATCPYCLYENEIEVFDIGDKWDETCEKCKKGFIVDVVQRQHDNLLN